MFQIGFSSGLDKQSHSDAEALARKQQPAARSCLARVYFADRNTTLTYFNDRFDLHSGDLVYVEGKLEGLLGCVTEVNYNFKIKPADYRRVVAVADSEVHGTFFMAGCHFITFDRTALPFEKAATWFAPPVDADEFVCGSDDSSFPLNALEQMKVSAAVAERGQGYYAENRVRYLTLDGTNGHAIVRGSRSYEVEFTYRDGRISALTCSCFCGYRCKHEVAVMLQLSETLKVIETSFADSLAREQYFAAVAKDTLFAFAIYRKESGAITL